MKVNIPSRRYTNHIALASYICEPSSYFEEVSCDAFIYV